MRTYLSALLISMFTLSAVAIDAPTGLMRTAEGIGVNNYEILISPQYTFSPAGMYLESELRYQANEELGVGLGFGAGEVGFNFGAFAHWYVFPDLKGQPAFSVLGGLFFNRLQAKTTPEDTAAPYYNYFVLKVAPTVSKAFRLSWGVVTPYGGGVLAPSFRLGQDMAKNELSLRTALGAQFAVDAIPGLRMMAEFGLSVINSVHQMAVGISYPLGAGDT